MQAIARTNIDLSSVRFPDSKVHGANIGPTWVLSAPDGSHVGPMNLAIRGSVTFIWGQCQEIPQPSITKINLKMTFPKFHSNLPGAIEWTYPQDLNPLRPNNKCTHQADCSLLVQVVTGWTPHGFQATTWTNADTYQWKFILYSDIFTGRSAFGNVCKMVASFFRSRVMISVSSFPVCIL